MRDRRRDRIGEIAVVGEQDRLAGRVMPGLAEQVGGDDVRLVLRVGDDDYLARSRDHVAPGDAVTRALRSGDPGFAGARRSATRRVGEACDSTCRSRWLTFH